MSLQVCVCVCFLYFIFFFLNPGFKKRNCFLERERWCGSGRVGSRGASQRRWGRGNCGQNILYENYFQQQKRKNLAPIALKLC